ncbi:leucyl/phenylalanyl-tRNA--protein transferase [Chromatiaceae bacterium AAb-1]|nr:leucyl/phenylalanyl-tRNA--protein transferase [Chromatiaceae bacterium AAb-1]
MSFPPVSSALAEPDGLLAMGGDLSPPRLINAYRNGIFPWFSDGDPLLWWSPATRALFAPKTLQLNRTLRKQLQKAQLTFTVNQQFARVVANCAAPRNKQPETWILPPIQQAYLQLHRLQIAHSIEVWQQHKLVGGLYGLALGGIFCGESMFNLIPNAAKFALVALQRHLEHYSAGWIDCQFPNPFLLQQGASTMPRAEYLQLLATLQQDMIPPAHWQPSVIDIHCHYA